MKSLCLKGKNMQREDENMQKKFKLQFVISEEDFYRFEEVRKAKFSSTSKQHLLETMFQLWMNRNARCGE